MSQVFLTSEELQNCSSQLTSLEQEIQSIFDQIRNRMNAVAGVWQSPAADALQQKFAQLVPSFAAYCQHIDAFAAFLSQTAQQYQENESQLSVSSQL